MPIQRANNDSIRTLLGEAALDRFINKRRGGDNAQKGYRYETLFGAHRIARLLRKFIDHGEDSIVEWQSEGFIDDFVVRRDDQASVKGYQLKNSPAVAWTPEIQQDFERQEAISRQEGYSDIRLRLVCSDQAAVRALLTGIPPTIAGYGRAFYFPWDSAILAVCNDYPWLREDFGYLSRHINPDIAEVSDVVQVVIGAWETLAPRAQVSLVMEKMRRTSPGIIRTLQSDQEAQNQLLREFVEIFNRLPQFAYHIERGFLNWSAYSGSTTGTISHDCFSSAFQGLQRHIVELNPQTFDEIENLLL